MIVSISTLAEEYKKSGDHLVLIVRDIVMLIVIATRAKMTILCWYQLKTL